LLTVASPRQRTPSATGDPRKADVMNNELCERSVHPGKRGQFLVVVDHAACAPALSSVEAPNRAGSGGGVRTSVVEDFDVDGRRRTGPGGGEQDTVRKDAGSAWLKEDRLHGHARRVPTAKYVSTFYAAKTTGSSGIGIQQNEPPSAPPRFKTG
jgi:hypothetical protein